MIFLVAPMVQGCGQRALQFLDDKLLSFSKKHFPQAHGPKHKPRF
jgi:hypothetical protein